VIFIRIAGLFFAFIQITLALRLILPFVEVPTALVEYVPPLLDITELLLAPVLAVSERFELTGLAEDLAPAAGELVAGPNDFEPAVLLAMVFWGLVAMFMLFVLRLIFRPQG
jgi:hypothetical protein